MKAFKKLQKKKSTHIKLVKKLEIKIKVFQQIKRYKKI